MECQVQLDRSVICRNKSFDPAENTPYFAEEAERLFRDATAKDRLRDGGNSIGVRFGFQIRWVLPT